MTRSHSPAKTRAFPRPLPSPWPVTTARLAWRGREQLASNGRAAVDDDRLARHIFGRFRRQENGRAGDVLRLPDTTERGHAPQIGFGLRVFPQGAGKIRADVARRDGVDPTSMRGERSDAHTSELQ